ncbi:hypothetical protein V1477_007797, partial [Vespula maculifrons]
GSILHEHPTLFLDTLGTVKEKFSRDDKMFHSPFCGICGAKRERKKKLQSDIKFCLDENRILEYDQHWRAMVRNEKGLRSSAPRSLSLGSIYLTAITTYLKEEMTPKSQLDSCADVDCMIWILRILTNKP